jgi:peptidoglycan/xylan/chitin deacetylase (PgdA/CDA1 family)
MTLRRDELDVALTFDAEHPSRPHSPRGVTERILATLSESEISATFFLQGRWVTARPDLARAISAEGHLIGNHSHYHASFPSLSVEGVRDDLRRAGEAIGEATGVDPRPWFRFPFGDGDSDEGLRDALLLAGYRHVGWQVDPNDWDPSRTPDEVERAVVDGTLAHGHGAIVLLHAWPATTAQALPGIVSRLRAEGALFVRLDQT